MLKYLSSRITFWFIIFCIIVLLSLLPSKFFVIDILSQFKLQYFYAGLIFSVIFLCLTFYRRIFFVFIIAALISSGVNRISLGEDVKMTSGNTKIALYNVLTKNKNYNLVLNEISLNNPNIIILLETDYQWEENLKELKASYPFYYEHSRDDNFGLSIFSKIPFKSIKLEEWTDAYIPVVKVEFLYQNKPVQLYCVHTLPPVSKFYTNIRNQMYKKINSISLQAISNSESVIFAGDFNSTIYSRAYRNNLRVLNDVQTTFGNKTGTWNAWWLPQFRISLDHFLVTPDINAKSFKVGQYIGSDHFPLYFEF